MDYSQSEESGTKYFNASNAKDIINKAFYQDFKFYLPDDILALSDRLSMHHSLELRVPFLDHKLVELCATIPASMKVGLFQKKKLLKKMAGAYLPSDVIHHRKQGFASPLASWLRKDLKEYSMEILSEENLQKHGFFNSKFVRKLLVEHMAGKESNNSLIFSLIVFQKWYQAYC